MADSSRGERAAVTRSAGIKKRSHDRARRLRPWSARIRARLRHEIDVAKLFGRVAPAVDLSAYRALTGPAREHAIMALLKQYEILESEKRMLQQIANAAVAFLVAGAVAAAVAFAQAQSEFALAYAAGVDQSVIDNARRAANVVPILVPPAMFGGGLFLVSLHARIRRVTAVAGHIERLVDATVGGTVSVLNWERVGANLKRGGKWTRHMLMFGTGLAIIAFFTVKPAVDRHETPVSPSDYLLINVVLGALLAVAVIGHRIDQMYYEHMLPGHFRPDL